MKRFMTLTLGISAAALLWAGPTVEAQDNGDAPPPGFVDENGDGIDDGVSFRHRRGGRHRGGALMSVVFSNLTKEQRASLQEKINTLITSGATQEEIHEAVHAELEGFGVDVIGDYLNRYSGRLTEDQLASLKETAEALKAEGATYRDIQAAVREELVELGITKPAKGLYRLSSVLTEDQMSVLQGKIDALVAEGASRGDIRAAIGAELETLGIGAPGMGFRGDRKGMMRGRQFGRFGRRGRFHPPLPPSEEAGASEDSDSSNEGDVN